MRHIDDTNEFGLVVAYAVAGVLLPVGLLIFPFVAGGLPAVVDLVMLILLGVATWLSFHQPSGIGTGWLRRRVSDSTPTDRFPGIRNWLSSPAAEQYILSAWLPALGTVGGRMLSNGWTPPHAPLILYAITTTLFGIAVSFVQPYRHSDEEAPDFQHSLAARGAYESEAWRYLPLVRVANVGLWVGALAAFLWLAISTGPYLGEIL